MKIESLIKVRQELIKAICDIDELIDKPEKSNIELADGQVWVTEDNRRIILLRVSKEGLKCFNVNIGNAIDTVDTNRYFDKMYEGYSNSYPELKALLGVKKLCIT